MKIKKARKRGTDEAFLQLMAVSGNSLLKLLGIPSAQAEKYRFRAVVLKEKKLEPDVECFSLQQKKAERIFIEFQGYSDEFIRYRLAAQVFWSCSQNSYKGKVIAGIIYTDKEYQEAALPLNIFKDIQLNGNFREIVLTDFTEKQLCAIDPKLIVLAPFTLSSACEKATQLLKAQEWCHEVKQAFSADQQQDALNVLGLFVLNRFRQIRYEEVKAMLNFDLMETVAGRQVYDKGIQQGLLQGLQQGLQQGGIEEARKMVIEALEEKFERVPNDIINRILLIEQQPVLRNLFRQSLRCQNLESFKENLSDVTT